MSKPTGTKEAATTAIGFIAATLNCTSLIRDKRTIAGRNICKKLGFERVAKSTSNESAASLNTPMRMAEFFPMPSIIAAYHMKQGNAKNFTMTLVGLCSRFGAPCPSTMLGLKNGSQIGITSTRHVHAARTMSIPASRYFREKNQAAQAHVPTRHPDVTRATAERPLHPSTFITSHVRTCHTG